MKHFYYFILTMFLFVGILSVPNYAIAGFPTQLASAAGCHKIVLKSGDIIEAAISQITPTEVKYKRCGKENDIETVISKKDILSITDESGEVIYRGGTTNGGNDNSNVSSSDGSKTDLWAILSIVEGGLALILSLIVAFGGMLLGIGGIISGALSLSRIKKNPSLKGKGLAWTGIATGGLALLLGLILLILVL